MATTTMNGGCGNPHCKSCSSGDRPRPIPSMMAEFEILYHRLMEMAQDGPADQAPSREVTIRVSELSLVFMAWLDRAMEHHARGGPRPFGAPIDLDNPADFERAVSYLSHLLPSVLDRNLTALYHGQHPLLFPPEPESDGIPF